MTPTPGSPQENHQRPNEAVLTPQPGGHDIPSAINSPHRPTGARSTARTQRPGKASAHLPAATYTPGVCRIGYSQNSLGEAVAYQRTATVITLAGNRKPANADRVTGAGRRRVENLTAILATRNRRTQQRPSKFVLCEPLVRQRHFLSCVEGAGARRVPDEWFMFVASR